MKIHGQALGCWRLRQSRRGTESVLQKQFQHSFKDRVVFFVVMTLGKSFLVTGNYNRKLSLKGPETNQGWIWLIVLVRTKAGRNLKNVKTYHFDLSEMKCFILEMPNHFILTFVKWNFDFLIQNVTFFFPLKLTYIAHMVEN